MAWTGIFGRNVSDMYNKGVDGYFGFQSFGLGGPTYPVQVDTESTANRLILQSSTQGLGLPLFLAEIVLVGTGLQVTNQALPGGVGSIPRLSAGTVTQIIVRVNIDLDNLLTALGLATSEAERQRIQALIPEVATEAHLRSQVATAVIAVDPFAAAALGTAMVQSFQTRSDAPMRAFLSQFSHVSTTLAADSDLVGFDNADFLVGGPGITNIFAGGGNDTLDGGGGANGLDGQGGADFYIMGPGPDRIADGGTDGGLDIASYANAPGAVTVDMENTGTIPQTGWAFGDSHGGIDGIIGSAFNDRIFGRNSVLGPTSSDLLQGGAGDDTLVGGEGSDTLIGGPGNDVIDGGGNQSEVGGPGPGDMAVYSAGPNEVHFFNAANGLLVVTPLGGVDLLNGVELFSFAGQVFGLNQLSLSGANLRIGDGGANTIGGTAGVDLLFGGAGDDQLSGEAANDILDGGDGNDRLFGGEGRDTLSGGAGVDTLNGGGGDDFLFGGDGGFDLRDVIFGGDGNDSIDGGAGNDSLSGGAGADTVVGDLGSDTLIGNEGNDLLAGGGGSDLIFGNAGADTLNGGFGYDRLNGGEGADQFFHQGVADHGSDWVQDYNAAGGDVLAVGIAGATASQFQVNYATTAGAGAAGVAEAFVIYRPTGQILWALVDGAGQDSLNLSIGGQVFDLLA